MEKHMIIMELLGHNIQRHFNNLNHTFSLKTVLALADQMLSRIQALHKSGYLHRNIKPDNFWMGVNENKHICYLIDFSLAKKYVKDNKLIPFKKGKWMTSALRYASVNSMLGFEQSRRDDLESIGYLLIYLAKGELPWQKLNAKSKDDLYRQVLKLKLDALNDKSEYNLTEGLPKAFKQYMQIIKSLEYESEPDYNQLKKLFKDCYIDKGYELDHIYDWDIEHDKPSEDRYLFIHLLV